MAGWQKKTLRLEDGHGWHAKPGYQIFVADRGAVRFDFPVGWEVTLGPDSVKLHDRPPPDDDCVIQVSVIHLPPGIDWSELPLAEMLADALKDDDARVNARAEITSVKRPDLELAWTETQFIDAAADRPARSRTCVARGRDVQTLITFDFWEDDAQRLIPVWKEVLRTLQLGRYVDDPRRGPPTVH